jgi:transposase-like protein
MKLDSKENANNQIQCGSCNCKYYPRFKYHSTNHKKGSDDSSMDYRCPQCGFGKTNEKNTAAKQNHEKKLLLD